MGDNSNNWTQKKTEVKYLLEGSVTGTIIYHLIGNESQTVRRKRKSFLTTRN